MMLRLVLLLVAALLARPEALRAETLVGTDLPIHRVADPSAPPVTAENLLASERFWPYRVTLAKAWQPEGAAKPLKAGSVGVLVRVETSGAVRADFGRDGLYEVPLDATDLLEGANLVRTGKLEKSGPNFAISILPRLADPSGPKVEPWSVVQSIGTRSYLVVFADPSDRAFAEMSKQLAPLRGRAGLLAILFPPGRQSDEQLRVRLAEVGWRSPFVLSYLAAPYTRTLIADQTPRPYVALYSSEGRTLFERAWGSETLTGLTAAVDTAIGPAAATVAAPAPSPAAADAKSGSPRPAEVETATP